MTTALSAPRLENRAGLPPERFAALAGTLAGQRSLRVALDWMLAQSPPLAFADLVAQDEFSSDALVPLPDGLWLAYDVS